MPGEWLRQRYASDDAQRHYRALHLLGDIPEDLHDFEAFYSARRDRLRSILTNMLVDAVSTVSAA